MGLREAWGHARGKGEEVCSLGWLASEPQQGLRCCIWSLLREGSDPLPKMSKMSPTSSRTGLLVFAPLKSTTRLKQTKGPEEGEQAGSSLFCSRPALSYFLLSGAGPPHSSFLTSLHRVSLKFSCVSLPPLTSPTSVLTSSLHFFVCPAWMTTNRLSKRIGCVYMRACARARALVCVWNEY